MDLKEIIETSLDCLFDVLKSITLPADIIVVPSDYDPPSGVVSGVEIVNEIKEVIFTEYERKRIDGQVIREFDRMALFKESEITTEITTEMNLRLSGEDWNIKNIQLDPSTSLYELQVRKP